MSIRRPESRRHELPTIASDPLVPLIGRAPDDIVFREPDGGITASTFLADARHLAAGLPEARHTVNLCQDRYCFAVAFAAALLRGQVSLLSSDRSPERLRDMADAYPGLYALSDEPGGEESLPRHPVLRLPRT